MIPAHLDRQITLCPEQPTDEVFLRNLLIAQRWAEFAPLPLQDDQKIALLTGQFRAKRQHYATHYPNAWRAIIRLQDQPMGSITLDQRPERLWIVDIGLHPDHCGQGLGSVVLHAILATAARTGQGVGLSVALGNPAERLYRRLGFHSISQDGAYQMMHWQPTPEDWGWPSPSPPVDQ